MTAGQLLMAFTLGTALLALWSYLRWPGAAPATMKGAIIRAVLALLVLMQVGAAACSAMASRQRQRLRRSWSSGWSCQS